MNDLDHLKISQYADHFTVTFKITPNSQNTKILGVYNGGLKVSVQAAPENGKANICLIKFLQNYFGLQKNQVEILSGEINALKNIAFYGISQLDWKSALCKSFK